ncbi:hypothetical protein BC834DRAFT_1043716 [Gloeopeniophorella convolvens]|nr:hypothetical protein BC834DRAFT_1043716 [Gloeopeniophorella convolvens]
METSDEGGLTLPLQPVSRDASSIPIVPTVEVTPGSGAESHSAQLLISIDVLQADGLARGTVVDKAQELFGKGRRFYVTATDGITTKETGAVKRRRHSVRWNKVLRDFTIDTHSHITLRLFSRQKQRNKLVGMANLSFEVLRVPLHDFGVRLDKGTAVQSRDRVTLYIGVTTLEPQSLMPRTVINAAERGQPTGPHAHDIPSEPTALVPPPATNDSPEASLALGALHRASDAMEQMKPASESHTAALEQADGLPDRLGKLGNLYSTWESAIGKIQWVVDVTDKIAEVHPYAKMAWSILSFIPKAFLAQVERDRHVQALLQVIHDAFDLLATEGLALSMNSKQKEIMLAMLRHVCDCGDFIQTYAADTAFRERLFANIGRGVEEQVKNYQETLLDLRDAFLRHVSVTTGTAVYKVKGGIDNISRKLEGIACQFEDIQKEIADIGLEAMIGEIPYGTGSRFRPDKGCIPGTRAAFLEYILNWANDPDSAHTLVLFGQAGTGKSSIAHEVARRFHDMDRLCSSFVFVRGERSERNSYLLTTLIRDLCDRYPSFKASLGKVISDDTSLRLGATDYSTLFYQLLQKPLEDLHLVGPVLVVIDALDESGDVSGRQGLHTFLADHIPQLPSNFRFFITSRPERQIESTFSSASSTQTIDIDDPTLSANAEDDILAYFLQHLPDRESDARRLAVKAERSFQWAAVACEYVQNPPDGLTMDHCIDDLLHLSSESKGMDPLDQLYHTSVMEELMPAFEPLFINTLTSLQRYHWDHDREE